MVRKFLDKFSVQSSSSTMGKDFDTCILPQSSSSDHEYYKSLFGNCKFKNRHVSS